MSLTEKQLLIRDAKRNIAAELLISVRQMTSGTGKVIAQIETSATGKSSALGASAKRAPRE